MNPETGECTSVDCPIGYFPKGGKCEGWYFFMSIALDSPIFTPGAKIFGPHDTITLIPTPHNPGTVL